MTQQHASTSMAQLVAKLAIASYFDGISNDSAGGWAYSRKQPDRRLTIEIIDHDHGDAVVARGAADQLREDLRASGIGDGHCHFILPLPDELFDGRAHRLSAREAETGKLLNGGPYDFGPATPQSILAHVEILKGRGQAEAAIQLLKQWMIRQPEEKAFADGLGRLLLEQTPLTYDAALSGLSERQEFQKAQRLLELVVAEAETRLSESVQ